MKLSYLWSCNNYLLETNNQKKIYFVEDNFNQINLLNYNNILYMRLRL